MLTGHHRRFSPTGIGKLKEARHQRKNRRRRAALRVKRITVEWPGAIAGAQPSKNRT
jgi:hypothetical protein